MPKVAVVIPTYKENLNELEKISLAQCRKVLGKYPLIFVAPAGKNFSYFEQGDGRAYFPPQFFQSVQTYNFLMTSPGFYATFKDFEYILIYQLDAFVFRDELEKFCSLGYDYIGAPWPTWLWWFRNLKIYGKIISNVGNGGFSLRNVKAHYDLLKNHPEWVRQFGENEDTFFLHCGERKDCDFKVAPYDVACEFSAETNPKKIIRKNGGKLPFGCHAWFKYDADSYISILREYGYDLRPLKDTMNNDAYEKLLSKSLLNEAIRRLNRRMQRGQSLMRYLPTKNFASIRVIRHPAATFIMARLFLEDNSLSDKIFLYDPDDQDLLLQDLTLQKQPHLIISFGGYDKNLISALEKKGFAYGKRFVLFHSEYLSVCEKIFRNLGK